MAKSKRYDDSIYIYRFVRKERTEDHNGLSWGNTPAILGKCMSYPHLNVPWPKILRELDKWESGHKTPNKRHAKVTTIEDTEYARNSDQIYYDQYVYGD